jgi:hypothetical protein
MGSSAILRSAVAIPHWDSTTGPVGLSPSAVPADGVPATIPSIASAVNAVSIGDDTAFALAQIRWDSMRNGIAGLTG